MKTLRVLCVSLFAALSIVVVGAGPSFACSCVSGDATDFVDRADVVVSGTVTDVVPPPERAVMSSLDPVTYVVDVDQVFKGEAGSAIEVLSPAGGASCGLEDVEPGRRYVVFAGHSTVEGKSTDALWANLCGGTGPASPALLSDVEQVTGAEAAPTAGGGVPDQASHSDPQLSGLAAPLGLVAGGSLLLLTVPLWLRLGSR